jgi:hypothetical protein
MPAPPGNTKKLVIEASGFDTHFLLSHQVGTRLFPGLTTLRPTTDNKSDKSALAYEGLT